MTCDRNHPCDGSSIAKALDYESSNVSQMLLDAAGLYRDPRAMQNLVADIQRREDPAKGDNLEVARDGRLLISKFNGSVEVLPIDVTGARIRAGAAPAGHPGGHPGDVYRGPGQYASREQAGVGDYVQRGVVGAITGAAVNGRDRGKGAIQGAGGAVAGKAVREVTGQEGPTGAVVEGLGACAAGALIGGKDGCKNGAIGSVVGQGLDWLTKKK